MACLVGCALASTPTSAIASVSQAELGHASGRSKRPPRRVKPRIELDSRSPLTQALFPRGEQRNAASLRVTVAGPSGGLELAYRRRLGQRFGIGGSFEYLLPNPGYGSTVTLAQTIEFGYWIPRTFSGLHVAVRWIFAEYAFVRDARHRGFAMGAGVVAGWSWWLPLDMTIDLNAGVRALAALGEAPTVCSRARECGYLRGDWLPRVELGFGYLF